MRLKWDENIYMVSVFKFFYLLFSCSTANFGPLLSRQLWSCNVFGCIFFNVTYATSTQLFIFCIKASSDFQIKNWQLAQSWLLDIKIAGNFFFKKVMPCICIYSILISCRYKLFKLIRIRIFFNTLLCIMSV